MDLFREQVRQSLKKILTPQTESPKKPPLPKKMLASIRLQSITLRKFQPAELKTIGRSSGAQMGMRVSRQNFKEVLNRYKQCRSPKNASRSRYQSVAVNLRQSQQEPFNDQQHLSYKDMVLQREKRDQGRRLLILKQVILENVKRKNEEMRLRQKTRLKTIM